MSRFQATQSKYFSDFSPIAYGDCALWLDAADPSTIVLSGSNVTQWKDKSGNNRNAVLKDGFTGATELSSNGRSVLSFEGTSSYLISYPTFPVSGYTIFTVQYNTNNTNNGTNSGYQRVLHGSQTNAFLFVGTLLGNVAVFTGSGTAWRDTNGTSTNNYLTWRVVSSRISNTSLRIFTDGTSVSTKTGTTSAFSDLLLGNDSANTQPWNGYIAEVLIYGTPLADIQRQQVEAYLSWKWGLRTSLPSSHPYTSILPFTRPFIPLDISGCSLWLDGADQDSFEFSGGSNIAVWRDKSGLGMDASQAVVSNQPVWVNNQVLISNGCNAWLMSRATLPMASNAIFIVHDPSNNALFNNRLLSYQGMGGSGNIIFPYALDANTPRGYFNSVALLTGNITLLRDFSVPGQLNLIEANISSGNQVIYNAGARTASSNVTISSNPSSSALAIGSGRPSFPTQVYAGGINEIITYSRTLTDGERRLLEGYLARKWGLSYLLPGINSNMLSPTSIPGCALWLDAADSDSIDLSGSSVVRWRDKSGNSRDASGGVSPTYTSNAINGRNVVTFNGTNTFLNTSDVYSLREFSIFTVVQRSGAITGTTTAPSGILSSLTFGSNNRNVHIGWTTNTQLRFGFFNNDICFNTFPTYTNPDPTYLINCSFVDRSRRILVNGDSTAYDSNRSLFQAGQQMVLGRFSNSFYNGHIAEYIVYNGVLKDRDRRQIEGYLAAKWNIPGFENPHIFKDIYSPAITFNPRAISNCILWLDAADRYSLTLSGSNVTQWNDKSGNGLNATQSTVGNRPTYGTMNSRTAVIFPGSTAFMNLPNITSVPISVFMIASTTVNVSNSFFVSLGFAPGPAIFLRELFSPDVFGVDNGPTAYTSTVRDTNPHVWSFVLPASTNGVFLLDGTVVSSNGFTLAAGSTFTSNSIGGWRQAPNGNAFNGGISEILIFNSALSSSERQQIEGYLAWKWALQNSLPSVHPYKKISPI